MRIRFAVAALTLAATLTLVGCSQAPTSFNTPVPAPKGHGRAVDFNRGYIQLGSGPKHVDVYLDLMCPFCKAFELENGARLFRDAKENAVTLRIHPLTFLNRLSGGTNYSTRAAAFLVDVADHEPDKTGQFLTELYRVQPAENSSGISDSKLRALVQAITGKESASPRAIASYETWADQETLVAEHGPIPASAEVKEIQQVPTIIVDGVAYTGLPNDPRSFDQFYRQFH